MNSGKGVLDACCGGKMFWFDRNHGDVLFCDVRRESYILCDGRKFVVEPDMLSDFRKMPFENSSFNLVVFDPPHLRHAGGSSWMNKKYGVLGKDWKGDLSVGFSECWRVLKDGGTLVFKWNETQVKLSEVLSCFSENPLFGHTTTRNLKTHWLVFYKTDRNGSS